MSASGAADRVRVAGRPIPPTPPPAVAGLQPVVIEDWRPAPCPHGSNWILRRARSRAPNPFSFYSGSEENVRARLSSGWISGPLRSPGPGPSGVAVLGPIGSRAGRGLIGPRTIVSSSEPATRGGDNHGKSDAKIPPIPADGPR